MTNSFAVSYYYYYYYLENWVIVICAAFICFLTLSSKITAGGVFVL